MRRWNQRRCGRWPFRCRCDCGDEIRCGLCSGRKRRLLIISRSIRVYTVLSAESSAETSAVDISLTRLPRYDCRCSLPAPRSPAAAADATVAEGSAVWPKTDGLAAAVAVAPLPAAAPLARSRRIISSSPPVEATEGQEANQTSNEHVHFTSTSAPKVTFFLCCC